MDKKHTMNPLFIIGYLST